MSAWQQWAEYYAALGLPVFPVWGAAGGVCHCSEGPACPTPGKHPLTPSGHTQASTRSTQIAQWAAVPGADAQSLAIAVPDGLCVVDVDPRNGGWEGLQAIRDAFGDLPPSWAARSGGGGLHLWFRVPAGFRLTAKLAPGVDIRQSGGYVIVAPSSHVSGGEYQWINAPGDAAPAHLPAHYQQTFQRGTADEDSATPTGMYAVSEHDLGVTAEMMRPHWVQGQRHDIAKFFAGWARQRGWHRECVEHVIRALQPDALADNPLRAVRAAYRISKAFGAGELSRLLGADTFAALEHAPNPELASLSEIWRPAMDRLRQMGQTRTTGPHNAPTPGWTDVDLTQDPPRLVPLIEGIGLYPGKPTAIFAKANAGKSPVANALALAVAHGRPFLGCATQQRNVAILASEGLWLTHRRIRRMMRVQGHDRTPLHLINTHGPLGGTVAEAEHRVLELVQQRQLGLVVVDTYNAAQINGTDANTDQVALLARALERVSDATGCIFVIVCHSGKNARDDLFDMSGHNALAGAVQEAWRVSVTETERGAVHTFACVRAIAAKPAAIDLEIVDVSRDNEPDWGLDVRKHTPPATSQQLAAAMVGATPPAAKLPQSEAAEHAIRSAFASCPPGTALTLGQLRDLTRRRTELVNRTVALLVAAGDLVVDATARPRQYSLSTTGARQ